MRIFKIEKEKEKWRIKLAYHFLQLIDLTGLRTYKNYSSANYVTHVLWKSRGTSITIMQGLFIISDLNYFNW